MYAYVANYGKGSLGVIDTATGKFIDNVTIGSFPNGISVTPDGRYIYVTVVSITKNTQPAKQQISGAGSPPGSQNPGYVIVLNATTYSTVARIQTGRFPFSIATGIANSV